MRKEKLDLRTFPTAFVRKRSTIQTSGKLTFHDIIGTVWPPTWKIFVQNWLHLPQKFSGSTIKNRWSNYLFFIFTTSTGEKSQLFVRLGTGRITRWRKAPTTGHFFRKMFMNTSWKYIRLGHHHRISCMRSTHTFAAKIYFPIESTMNREASKGRLAGGRIHTWRELVAHLVHWGSPVICVTCGPFVHRGGFINTKPLVTSHWITIPFCECGTVANNKLRG